MVSSGLKARLQVKYRKAGITFKDNNKMFFKEYPHYVKCESHYVGPRDIRNRVFTEFMSGRDEMRDFHSKMLMFISNKDIDAKLRLEGRRCTIFCHDPDTFIKLALKHDVKNQYVKFNCHTVGIMDESILGVSTAKVEGLPKAVNVVVNHLPLNMYRYKVHFTNGYGLKKIGSHEIEAIVDQINNHPGCSKFSPEKRDAMISLKYYSTNYFYANDEDIFSIIFLISQNFITKIEKFKLVGELNE